MKKPFQFLLMVVLFVTVILSGHAQNTKGDQPVWLQSLPKHRAPVSPRKIRSGKFPRKSVRKTPRPPKYLNFPRSASSKPRDWGYVQPVGYKKQPSGARPKWMPVYTNSGYLKKRIKQSERNRKALRTVVSNEIQLNRLSKVRRKAQNWRSSAPQKPMGRGAVSKSKPYVIRGKKNVYWGLRRYKEKAYTSDIAGHKLRRKNFQSERLSFDKKGSVTSSGVNTSLIGNIPVGTKLSKQLTGNFVLGETGIGKKKGTSTQALTVSDRTKKSMGNIKFTESSNRGQVKSRLSGNFVLGETGGLGRSKNQTDVAGVNFSSGNSMKTSNAQYSMGEVGQSKSKVSVSKWNGDLNTRSKIGFSGLRLAFSSLRSTNKRASTSDALNVKSVAYARNPASSRDAILVRKYEHQTELKGSSKIVVSKGLKAWWIKHFGRKETPKVDKGKLRYDKNEKELWKELYD